MPRQPEETGHVITPVDRLELGTGVFGVLDVPAKHGCGLPLRVHAGKYICGQPILGRMVVLCANCERRYTAYRNAQTTPKENSMGAGLRTLAGTLTLSGKPVPINDLQYAPQGSDKPPTAAEILRKAADTMEERGRQYDSPAGERSMGKAVKAFNAITGRGISVEEGWLLLGLVKSVRQYTSGKRHEDSAIDHVAYAALEAEEVLAVLSKEKPHAT